MLSLFHFANKYGIELIKSLVEDYLIHNISSTNVCSITYFIETTVSPNRLQQKCIDFIIQKLEENQTIFELETLDKDVMLRIFAPKNTLNV